MAAELLELYANRKLTPGKSQPINQQESHARMQPRRTSRTDAPCTLVVEIIGLRLRHGEPLYVEVEELLLEQFLLMLKIKVLKFLNHHPLP